MRDGFVRVGAASPRLRVADCRYNEREILKTLAAAREAGVSVLVLPELCLTGYTAGDLLLQGTLREAALAGVERIARATAESGMLAIVGCPLAVEGRMYNCAFVLAEGRALGVVPKRYPPNYGEFYELRHFTPGQEQVRQIRLWGQSVPFGGNLLFVCEEMPEMRLAVEICEDLWVPDSPGCRHALAGATVIANPSASDETVGKADYRRLLLRSQSARLMCGYIYADAGSGESSTDMVFAGHNLIAENGVLLAESPLYGHGLLAQDLDVGYLAAERVRVKSFGAQPDTHARVPFHLPARELALRRPVDPAPFVPADARTRARRCEEILDIQVHGLMTRMQHIGASRCVLGISGGLDSTLALLVTARAFQRLGLDARDILAVTMPCFGTTQRTRGNAVALVKSLGATLREVNIRDSVSRHFEDIGHDPGRRDAAYENAQARERTQVLMDLANDIGGIVVGTGDLSELALGWATYNGDHMSMYGVNASVPKTLVRHLVRHAADSAGPGPLRDVLLDVLDTPVSPELLPPEGGEIAQKTEDLVGPYDLHDFFLYHMLRRMDPPRKILRLANLAFRGVFSAEEIEKWLRVFLRRFFSQQFKRSCLPDGPKVGSVALSPRGDWRMPSDAAAAAWLADLEGPREDPAD